MHFSSNVAYHFCKIYRRQYNENDFFRELIETIAEFEDREFAGTTRDTDFNSVLRKMKLAPLNESGGAALLHMVNFVCLPSLKEE